MWKSSGGGKFFGKSWKKKEMIIYGGEGRDKNLKETMASITQNKKFLGFRNC